MGKGSARRKEDTDKIRNNWDAIFKKKDKTDDGQREQSETLQQPPIGDSGNRSDGTHELLPR